MADDAIQAAKAAGYDAGLNGPNTTNCHFRHFATPQQTEAWEDGKRLADRDKRERDIMDEFEKD